MENLDDSHQVDTLGECNTSSIILRLSMNLLISSLFRIASVQRRCKSTTPLISPRCPACIMTYEQNIAMFR